MMGLEPACQGNMNSGHSVRIGLNFAMAPFHAVFQLNSTSPIIFKDFVPFCHGKVRLSLGLHLLS
jgi:hypothetical protein